MCAKTCYSTAAVDSEKSRTDEEVTEYFAHKDMNNLINGKAGVLNIVNI